MTDISLQLSLLSRHYSIAPFPLLSTIFFSRLPSLFYFISPPIRPSSFSFAFPFATIPARFLSLFSHSPFFLFLFSC